MTPSRRATGVRRSGIREVMELASARPGVLHLEVGEPAFATPAHIVEAAVEAARGGYTHYTPNKGLDELREVIARTVGERNGIDATPEEVVVTTGAVTALLEGLAAVLDAGDRVLLPDPGWPNYEMMAAMLDAVPVRYELDAANGFVPDPDRIEALLRATPRARAMVVNSPNNPTGAVYPPEVVARLVEVAEANGCYVVSDECYERIVFEGEHVSPAALASGPGVISVFSMSKSYAMTGWRVGYLVAERAIADVTARVSEAAISCATAIAQKAAQAALEGGDGCVTAMCEQYRVRRDAAVALLRDADLLVSCPRGAFYVLADIGAATVDTYAFARDLLLTHGVAVAPGETFGPSGRGLVRLSLAASLEDLVEGCHRLARAVATFGEGR